MANTAQDNSVAYIAATVSIGLIITFAFAWYHFKGPGANLPNVAFAKFGPYQVLTPKFGILTSISVETGPDNIPWAMQNKTRLDVIFQMVLAKSDPQPINGENSMQMVQEALRNAANQDLHTDNVQAVWLTDYVLQPVN
jgi:hypothetical protein